MIMFDALLPAILLVAGIGLIAGLLLAFASTVMAVPVNEKEVAVRDCLPGANCGACGFSGCDGYAKAVAAGGVATNLCRPGGADAAEKISAILGVETEKSEPVVAFVHCGGECGINNQKEVYEGIRSCAAEKMLPRKRHRQEFWRNSSYKASAIWSVFCRGPRIRFWLP